MCETKLPNTINAVCFTAQGLELGEKLARHALTLGIAIEVTRCGTARCTIHEWTKRCFPVCEALLFIGAVGIAVRAVAPYVKSKTADPAVVVMDEAGKFAIPLLSGHIGGANKLAVQLAKLVGATPMVTTATDLRGVFAIDVWAAENNIFIRNTTQIKMVSGKLLAGKTVKVYSDFESSGALPAGLCRTDTEKETADVVLSVQKPPLQPTSLWLVPPVLVLGIGCRRGIAGHCIDTAFRVFCDSNGIDPMAVSLVCSIDLKQNETGLRHFCDMWKLPFHTFTAQELVKVAGTFSASDFVKKTTGVSNVCERSAVLGSAGGKLLVGKTVQNGITLALAQRHWKIQFEENA